MLAVIARENKCPSNTKGKEAEGLKKVTKREKRLSKVLPRERGPSEREFSEQPPRRVLGRRNPGGEEQQGEKSFTWVERLLARGSAYSDSL